MKDKMTLYFEKSREAAKNPPENTFDYDRHRLALNEYKNLEQWEKYARSMAGAILNQPVYIWPEDQIFGHVYYNNAKAVEQKDPDLDEISAYHDRAKAMIPGLMELREYQLFCSGSQGHIAWDWNYILKQGTTGLRRRCQQGLLRKKDEESRQFYQGVLILLDALEGWSLKHAEQLELMGRAEEADRCRRVPMEPAKTFREAVQSFFMQYIVVMKENPFGGNSPGRLDYYLWPYLEADLAAGRCTMEEARELIDELMIRIDERIYANDMWVESVVVGGSYPNGASAINPLSYMMIESTMKYDIVHPAIYVRLPDQVPEDFSHLCARYLMSGSNRAQILGDRNVINALVHNGVSESDAVDYYCGGCMEVGVQGRTSDFLFTGFQNLPKLLELFMTDGKCLKTGKRMEAVHGRSLTEYEDFETFYADFIGETRRICHLNFEYQDILSEGVEKQRPAYLISSMVEDCLARGQNMHGGGARYHDYGAAVLGMPNTADSLYAIKKAVFDDKICTAEEMLAALEADFEGYELLRRKLLAIPKYGQENAEADDMARRVFSDMGEIYESYVNRFGGNGKLVILSFVWAPVAGEILGATPDGRRAGFTVAQGVTPQGMAMTKGITAAINSCTSMPFEVFCGGASTMWDIDSSWASEPLVEALFTTFFDRGGHIFQGNTTDVETLRKAQEHPEDYGEVIVRVGGFSARFVSLNKQLQDDIINRIRHSA